MRASSTGPAHLLDTQVTRYALRMPLKGYEYTLIECRGCGRKVERAGIGNELVGCQERLRCAECGHRGADMRRVWHVGPPPRALPFRRRDP